MPMVTTLSPTAGGSNRKDDELNPEKGVALARELIEKMGWKSCKDLSVPVLLLH